MESKVIFNSTILDGPMSGQKKFYPEEMSKEEIQKDLYKRRVDLGRKYGLNGTKIIVPLQKNANSNDMYEDGKYVVLNDEEVVYQEIDLWNVNIPTDIMIIKKGLPGIMMAYPVADCPVIVMEDKKKEAIALAHCGAEYINRHLPEQIVDSLVNAVGSNEKDIDVYVGPSASKQTFTYDSYPKWATDDKTWEGAIKEKNGLYYIDMKLAILRQLKDRMIKLESIKMSNVDTITNPYYYSNNASFNGKQNKNGRFLVGAGYVKRK